MTFTIKWWMVSIALFLFPILYATFRKPQGNWDMNLDSMAMFLGCWLFAIGLTLGKLF